MKEHEITFTEESQSDNPIHLLFQSLLENEKDVFTQLPTYETALQQAASEDIQFFLKKIVDAMRYDILVIFTILQLDNKIDQDLLRDKIIEVEQRANGFLDPFGKTTMVLNQLILFYHKKMKLNDALNSLMSVAILAYLWIEKNAQKELENQKLRTALLKFFTQSNIAFLYINNWDSFKKLYTLLEKEPFSCKSSENCRSSIPFARAIHQIDCKIRNPENELNKNPSGTSLYNIWIINKPTVEGEKCEKTILAASHYRKWKKNQTRKKMGMMDYIETNYEFALYIKSYRKLFNVINILNTTTEKRSIKLSPINDFERIKKIFADVIMQESQLNSNPDWNYELPQLPNEACLSYNDLSKQLNAYFELKLNYSIPEKDALLEFLIERDKFKTIRTYEMLCDFVEALSPPFNYFFEKNQKYTRFEFYKAIVIMEQLLLEDESINIPCIPSEDKIPFIYHLINEIKIKFSNNISDTDALKYLFSDKQGFIFIKSPSELQELVNHLSLKFNLSLTKESFDTKDYFNLLKKAKAKHALSQLGITKTKTPWGKISPEYFNEIEKEDRYLVQLFNQKMISKHSNLDNIIISASALSAIENFSNDSRLPLEERRKARKHWLLLRMQKENLIELDIIMLSNKEDEWRNQLLKLPIQFPMKETFYYISDVDVTMLLLLPPDWNKKKNIRQFLWLKHFESTVHILKMKEPMFAIPGTKELHTLLLKLPNIQLFYYSAGSKERNEEFLQHWISLLHNDIHWRAKKNHYSILTARDENNKVTKKDLLKIAGARLENTLIVDDNIECYIGEEQRDNYVVAPPVGITDFEILYKLKINGASNKKIKSTEQFKRVNSVLFYTGLILSALEIAVSLQIDFRTVLKSLQYKETQYNHDLKNDLKYYKIGRDFLRNENPDLNYCGIDKNSKAFTAITFHLNKNYQITSIRKEHTIAVYLYNGKDIVGQAKLLTDTVDVSCITEFKINSEHVLISLENNKTVGDAFFKFLIKFPTVVRKPEFRFILTLPDSMRQIAEKHNFDQGKKTIIEEKILLCQKPNLPVENKVPDGITFSQKIDKTQINELLQLLNENAYEHEHLTLDRLQLLVKHSICFFAIDNKKIVGFARVLSDKNLLASLLDVVVAHNHQKQDIETALMYYIFSNPIFSSICNWITFTNKEKSLYEKFGFVSAKDIPDRKILHKLRLQNSEPFYMNLLRETITTVGAHVELCKYKSQQYLFGEEGKRKNLPSFWEKIAPESLKNIATSPKMELTYNPPSI